MVARDRRTRRLAAMVGFSSIFPATRWSLIRSLEQEPARTGALLGLYAEAVARYLAIRLPHLRGRGLLEDVVQEVLTALLQRSDLLARARPEAGGRFRYLLMRLAVNAARNADRRLSTPREVAAEAVAAWADTGDVEPDAGMDRAWAHSLIRTAWDELAAWVEAGTAPEPCLRVAREHLLDGRPLRAIAEAQGLSLATCHRRLAEARRLLRRSIIDHLAAAGELPADASPQAACDHILEAASG